MCTYSFGCSHPASLSNLVIRSGLGDGTGAPEDGPFALSSGFPAFPVHARGSLGRSIRLNFVLCYFLPPRPLLYFGPTRRFAALGARLARRCYNKLPEHKNGETENALRGGLAQHTADLRLGGPSPALCPSLRPVQHPSPRRSTCSEPAAR